MNFLDDMDASMESREMALDEVIRKENGKYVLRSKDGSRVLGRFDSRADAERHERRVNFFKHKST